MSDQRSKKRWDPYVFFQGDGFDYFWQDHVHQRERRFLFLVGRGFDSRALLAVRRILEFGAMADVWLLAFDNGFEESELRRKLTDQNLHDLSNLSSILSIAELPISIGGSVRGNATSVHTRMAIKNAGALDNYTDVIVDISAMPRMVALTAVTQVLHDLDVLAISGGIHVNLHVTAAESVAADIGAAKGTLSEEVTHLVGFSGELGSVTSDQIPRVWFPILGEGQEIRLNRIKEALNPDEICPVIPFPSRDARRGDEIIKEHRQILFDDFQVEPANILRASEYNPFEAYRQIYDAMDRYRVALSELGGCKAFVSPLSSKLLSVGPLLACYDHKFGGMADHSFKVGIPYVETADYADPETGENGMFGLSTMWIRGEWEI